MDVCFPSGLRSCVCRRRFAWTTADYAYESRPSVIFHESFGFWPTPDVKITNSYRRDSLKFDDSSLEFFADQATIDRILANRFHPIEWKDIADSYSSQPFWWPRVAGPEFKFYGTNVRSADFHDYFLPQQVLIYDAHDKKVYERNRQ